MELQKQRFLAFLKVLLFIIVLIGIYNMLGNFSYDKFIETYFDVFKKELLLALGFVLLNYMVLFCYDLLAIKYIKSEISFSKIFFTSFIAHGIGNIFGFLGNRSSKVRGRLYSFNDVSSDNIFKISLFCTVTFWLGLISMSSVVFINNFFSKINNLGFLRIPSILIGIIFLAMISYYIYVGISKKEYINFKNWKLKVPNIKILISQLIIGTLDWGISAAVLYILLRDSMMLTSFLPIFFAAQIIGLMSGVPGGIGIFELSFLYLYNGDSNLGVIFSGIIVYRLIYFVLPFLISSISYSFYEEYKDSSLKQKFGKYIPSFMPSVLSNLVFIAGLVLILGAFLPNNKDLFLFQNEIAGSLNFFNSIFGVILLILSRGIKNRLKVAYIFSVVFLATGLLFMTINFSIIQSSILLMILILLINKKREFNRKTSIFDMKYKFSWIITVVLSVISFVFIGFFGIENIEYNRENLFNFFVREDVSNLIQILFGMTLTFSIFFILKLLKPLNEYKQEITEENLEVAKKIVKEQKNIDGNLVLLRDKYIMFDDEQKAFIMFGIKGKTWVALGDPIGDDEYFSDLIWKFYETTKMNNGFPAFYEVSQDYLNYYLDIGLTLLKIGEDGKIPIENYDLVGKSKKKFRRVINKFDKEGYKFEVIPQEKVSEIMDTLETISDIWITEKKSKEKGFSLGFFDKDYLSNFDIAVVKKDDKIVGFANILTTNKKEEVSIDLMRYIPEFEDGIMDYLFIKIMLWGKDNGYKYFDLGMAPLSGIQANSNSPLWNKFSVFIYKNG
ncbi:MAG: bifunctional lysylphosphatidylglycerol flippase/synthetase MprF, partial [Fusobacteriota bacterium]